MAAWTRAELQDQVADFCCGFRVLWREVCLLPSPQQSGLTRRGRHHLSPAVYLDMRELVFKACTVSVWEKVRLSQLEKVTFVHSG